MVMSTLTSRREATIGNAFRSSMRDKEQEEARRDDGCSCVLIIMSLLLCATTSTMMFATRMTADEGWWMK